MDKKTYIGVKMIEAKPMTRGEYNDYRGWKMPEGEKADDKGYLVCYMPDGYESWSPAHVFEKSYLSIKQPDKISVEDVDTFMGELIGTRMDSKTTHVRAELVNGFVQHEVSSCVEPENYDHEIGMESATNRIRDRVWMLLGFALQWARNGVQNNQQVGEAVAHES